MKLADELKAAAGKAIKCAFCDGPVVPYRGGEILKPLIDPANILTLCTALEKAEAALRKIIDWNLQTSRHQYGDETKAEGWACVREAREALKGLE